MPVDPLNATAAEVLQNSLAYQRARIEESARHIAQANVPLAANAAAGHAAPSARLSGFAQQLGVPEPQDAPAGSAPSSLPVRLALEPGSPNADEHGIVRYPQVDLATEMTTMMAASRAYEASVRAYNILKGMTGKAMEIGK
jgi:flagellar basal-body rod protein FlgC